ncbi:hypothetical protein GQ607_005997, partial [Colletotrichum asianum]
MSIIVHYRYIQLVHRFIAVASLSVEYAAAAHICESGGP